MGERVHMSVAAKGVDLNYGAVVFNQWQRHDDSRAWKNDSEQDLL